MKEGLYLIHLYREARGSLVQVYLCGANIRGPRDSVPAHIAWYTDVRRSNHGTEISGDETLCQACVDNVTPLELLAGIEL